MSTETYVNNIWQADCTELLSSFEEDSVDLVVTSPPYDNLRNYRGYEFPFERIAAELTRVIKHGGVIVWVVSDGACPEFCVRGIA